ncbi:MAG TPA: tRNA uridine-5-carboxymethylaminomethyl(34) synthesis GTPase MnmE [Acidocella sp.]|nr:MAG: tRNA uridine-5-carboxymethylaminomethyl(34) synthesis GTPase MnmE [Rhodospirillales bacterium 20-64-7]HQT38768.1 tRNA uridine-5-carboxymethylaminomethyl(34) synthesis GTPase MnmE [Acidocella sp.]
MDTIFAAITGRGGAVGVVRLSGGAALPIVAAMVGRLPGVRRASLRDLRDARGQLLDHALVTVFAAPHSYTGEDCVELALHGGRAVLAAVSAALVAAGARPAEAGEFSRRAFLNGRMDLLQAEAIADLVAAETEAQRRLAVDGADVLHAACAAWREALRLMMAQQEALIDFPDEDLPPEVDAKLLGNIKRLHDEMRAVLEASPRAERLREGLEFVILGSPNAGKSTLLNALAGEDVAIVSEIPGTTRDAIGVRVDLGGVPVHITDTAGLRATDDVVEAEGVRRARLRGAKADLVIAVAGADAPVFPEIPQNVENIYVFTKSDLVDFMPLGFLHVSAKTGEGMAKLVEQLTEAAIKLTDTRGAAALARPRQIACVQDTVEALRAALEAKAPEVRGEELRIAASALGRLMGTIGVEEILDAVFSGFCIGK